jgi:HEAT repeat protein
MSHFLAIIVGAQLVMLLGVSALLIGHRWVSGSRRSERDRERAELGRAIVGVLSQRTPGDELVRLIDAARPDSVAAALQRHGAQINGEEWEAIVTLVRTTRWFATTVSRNLQSRFWWRRLVGARMLAVLGSDEDLSTVRALVTDRHPAVKVAAITILRRVHAPDLMALVLDEAIGAPSVVRYYFFDTLLTVGPALVPTLSDRLRTPRSEKEIPALVRMAGDVGGPELLDTILPYTHHVDLDVRAATARALGAYPHPRSRDALVELLKDGEWQVRTRAATALGSIRALEARSALAAVLNDSNWWVRLRAAVALRQLGPAGVELLKTTQSSGDRFAAEMARYTLGLTDAAVADYLV